MPTIGQIYKRNVPLGLPGSRSEEADPVLFWDFRPEFEGPKQSLGLVQVIVMGLVVVMVVAVVTVILLLPGLGLVMVMVRVITIIKNALGPSDDTTSNASNSALQIRDSP